MLPVYILLILICLIMVINKRRMAENVEINRKTIAFDFDDCLKNYKTKKPIKAVVNEMKCNYKNGHRIIIVTARGQVGVPEIKQFLKEIDMDVGIPIFATGDSISRKKSKVIKQENVDVFFDDQPGFLEDVAINCPNVQLFQTFPDDEVSIRPYVNRKRVRE